MAHISHTPSDGLDTSAPTDLTMSAIKRTSLRLGTFLRTHFSSVSSAAANIGRHAFFAPETLTSPDNAEPPLIKSESIF